MSCLTYFPRSMRRMSSTPDAEKEQQRRSGNILDEGGLTRRPALRSEPAQKVKRARGSNDGASCREQPPTDSPRRRHLSPGQDPGNSRRSRGGIKGSCSSSSSCSNSSSDGDDDNRKTHLVDDLRSAGSSTKERRVRSAHENEVGSTSRSERGFSRDRPPDVNNSRNSGGGGRSCRRDSTPDTETEAEDSWRRNGHGRSRDRSVETRRGRTSGRRDVSGGRSSSSGLRGGGRRRSRSSSNSSSTTSSSRGGRTRVSSRGHGAGRDTAEDPRPSLSATTKTQQRRRRADEPTNDTTETEYPPARSGCGDSSSQDRDAGGVVGQRSSAGRSHARRSKRGGGKGARGVSAEAWGSESTATPSPRDPGGSVGEVGSSGSNGGGLNGGGGVAWLEEPRAGEAADGAEKTHRRGSRCDKVRRSVDARAVLTTIERFLLFYSEDVQQSVQEKKRNPSLVSMLSLGARRAKRWHHTVATQHSNRRARGGVTYS